MSRPEAFAPVAVTRRSGLDESVHFGAVVGLGADGSQHLAVGDPTVTIYPRSANKPIQAVAMVRAGLDLPAEHLFTHRVWLGMVGVLCSLEATVPVRPVLAEFLPGFVPLPVPAPEPDVRG